MTEIIALIALGIAVFAAVVAVMALVAVSAACVVIAGRPAIGPSQGGVQAPRSPSRGGPYTPGVQGGKDKTGIGLGLSIARRSIEANDGTLRARDVPGTGCVFTIDLPRRGLPELALSVASA